MYFVFFSQIFSSLFIFFLLFSFSMPHFLFSYKLTQLCNECVCFFSFLSLAVYRLLNKLGGYLSPSSSAPGDITPLVAALLKMNGAPLFDFYIDTDLQDSTKFAVFLDLPIEYQINSFFQRNLVSFCKKKTIFIISFFKK